MGGGGGGGEERERIQYRPLAILTKKSATDISVHLMFGFEVQLKQLRNVSTTYSYMSTLEKFQTYSYMPTPLEICQTYSYMSTLEMY